MNQVSAKHRTSSPGKRVTSSRLLAFRHSSTEPRRAPGASALVELERQRAGDQLDGQRKRFLTWAERQRLVDAAPSPLWPMLVALGMLCVVSMSLSAEKGEGGLIKVLNERRELPFVPHEAEDIHERRKVPVKEQDVDSDAESNVSLLHKKREFISKDEGDKPVKWMEKPTPLGELMFNGKDYQILLTRAPPELAALAEVVLKNEKDIKKLAKGHHKIAALLQQDLLAVAELILLCRIMALGGSLDKAETARLRELLKLVSKRFGEEWPEALGVTRYVADVRQRNRYLRLVSHVASAAEAMGTHVLSNFEQDGEAGGNQARTGLSWKIMTGRLEIQRLLNEAKFFDEIAEVFKID